MKEFDELLEIMHRLRQECPWDREQDLLSLRKFLLEEAYECVGALDEVSTHGLEPLIEELGDVLLQVVFQSELISEQIHEKAILLVLEKLKDKLIRRHPHVFGNQKAGSAEAVLKQWNEIKKSEKAPTENPSHLDGLTKSHTALQTAQKIGDRTKKVAFDWSQPEEVWTHFISEIEELKAAKTPQELEHEFGDVFFALVQWGRHKKLDAETALAQANRRFESRFRKMETFAKQDSRDFEKLSLDEKEKLWQRAKLAEKH